MSQKQEVSTGSLRAYLSAFRTQRDENATDLISVLALALQETMVRGAIDGCRKNGVSEDEILAILGEDRNLAFGGTRVEGHVMVKEGVAKT